MVWRSNEYQSGGPGFYHGLKYPKGYGPLGRVIVVNTGRDNLVRSARIKTKATYLVRPVTKLVQLEGIHYDWRHALKCSGYVMYIPQ